MHTKLSGETLNEESLKVIQDWVKFVSSKVSGGEWPLDASNKALNILTRVADLVERITFYGCDQRGSATKRIIRFTCPGDMSVMKQALDVIWKCIVDLPISTEMDRLSARAKDCSSALITQICNAVDKSIAGLLPAKSL